MAGINIPEIVAVDYVFCPLSQTWYEKEMDTLATKTYRFARRRDHTGVLIKLNMIEFYDSQ